MAKRHRYGRKKGKRRARHHRKDPCRVAAGRKAWRAKVRRYGSKAAALAATFGKRRRKKVHHRTSARRRAAGRRAWAERKRKMGWGQAQRRFHALTRTERALARRARKAATKAARRAAVVSRAYRAPEVRSSGFAPEVRARLLALKAAREAAARAQYPVALPG